MTAGVGTYDHSFCIFVELIAVPDVFVWLWLWMWMCGVWSALDGKPPKFFLAKNMENWLMFFRLESFCMTLFGKSWCDSLNKKTVRQTHCNMPYDEPVHSFLPLKL